MIGKILNPEQGVCHDLFKPQEDEAPPEDGSQNGEVQPKVEDILTTYKHEFIDVKNLVTNNRLHFWKVPRLGCFMAVPLVYNSCLSENALDTAIANWAEVSKEIEQQEKDKAEYDEQMAQEKEEKIRAGEAWNPEEKVWPELKAAPFITQELKFAVCIDTLGQDRDLTDDQRRFILETTQKFYQTWDKFESEKLLIDRDNRMKFNVDDKEWLSENFDKLKDEEDKFVDDKIAAVEEEFVDDDHKSLVSNKFRLEFQALIFKEREEFSTRLIDLKKFKVIKYGKFM